MDDDTRHHPDQHLTRVAPPRRSSLRNARRRTVGLAASAVLALAACGGDHATADEPTSVPAEASPSSSPAETTGTIPATTAVAATSSTVLDDAWRQQVGASCDSGMAQLAAIPDHDGSAAGISAQATASKVLFLNTLPMIEVPASLRQTLETLDADAITRLDDSIELAAAGDVVGARRAFDEGWDRLTRKATAIAIAGARCGPADPARVANADLTVPLEMHPNQLDTGFGSIWASEGLAGRVVRLDPATGAVQARVDVGEAPLKLQPADGRMWVRTADAYVAIDPTTNTVTATLPKADVGPAANRSWAVDGAMWICDGRHLHRYDPTTVAAVAALDLQVDCNAVYATDDLVAAWSYNEDQGESGTSAVAFVDPTTNTVLATVDLPVDVSGPALLPGKAFFPGYYGSKGAVVDLNTWTVTATPDLGVAAGGTGQPASDGKSIYVVTADEQDVLRVDANTFAVTDIIEPLGANAVALDDTGALWVARGQPYDIVQRFDVGRP